VFFQIKRVRVQELTFVHFTPHPNLLPSRGEGAKTTVLSEEEEAKV